MNRTNNPFRPVVLEIARRLRTEKPEDLILVLKTSFFHELRRWKGDLTPIGGDTADATGISGVRFVLDPWADEDFIIYKRLSEVA